MSNLTFSHRATSIQYSPSTYAFDNATTGWLSTSTGHSTQFPNASFQIEWTGKGIHVNGMATGNGTVLLSLDGGASTQAQVNQSSGLADYHSLGFGNHSLVVSNVPGGNLTLTGYSLDLQKGQEGRTVARREIASTIQNATGGVIQNPEFLWDGDWAVQPSGTNAAPIMGTRPRTLTSFSLNISESSLVQIYGAGTTYSLHFHWEGDSSQRRRRSLTSEIVRRDEVTHFPGEKLEWSKSLDRTLTYFIEVDVIPDGGQWAMSRVVVTDSIPTTGINSTKSKIIIGVTVPLGLLLIAFLFFLRRRHVRRKYQREYDQPSNRNMEISSPLPNKSTSPPSYTAVPLSEADGDVKFPSPQVSHA